MGRTVAGQFIPGGGDVVYGNVIAEDRPRVRVTDGVGGHFDDALQELRYFFTTSRQKRNSANSYLADSLNKTVLVGIGALDFVDMSAQRWNWPKSWSSRLLQSFAEARTCTGSTHSQGMETQSYTPCSFLLTQSAEPCNIGAWNPLNESSKLSWTRTLETCNCSLFS
jgi:hypothetical protein